MQDSRSVEQNNPVAGSLNRDPLAKAIKLIGWMADHGGGPFGVRQLAAALGTPPSTVHRTLRLLEQNQMVLRVGEGQYSLGLEMFRLSQQVLAVFDIKKLARRHLVDLVEKCNESAFLGLYDKDRQQMVLVDSVSSTHPLRYIVDLNEWRPVHAGASGLGILAFLPPAEIEEIFDRTGLYAVTERTLTDPEHMSEELELTRSRGYAITHGQRISGSVGLAAPVRDATGTVIGDVCLTVPEQRFRAEDEGTLSEALLSCAAAISGELTHGARRRAQ